MRIFQGIFVIPKKYSWTAEVFQGKHSRKPKGLSGICGWDPGLRRGYCASTGILLYVQD